MLIHLLYYLGVRIGESLALQWNDVLWKKKLIHVWRDVDSSTNPEVIGELKTKAANRYIPIPSPLLEYLKPLRSLPDIFLVSGETKYANNVQANYIIHKVMYHANLCKFKDGTNLSKSINVRTDIIPKYTAHNFRHHYVTSRVQAEDRPEFIKTIVGHVSYQTTIELYTYTSWDHYYIFGTEKDYVKEDFSYYLVCMTTFQNA